MGRRLIESAITTRAARLKLRNGFHWRAIDPDIHLGYRKSNRAGRWLVRWRNGADYLRATLGVADDALDADGRDTLDYQQAMAAAQGHVQKMRKAAVEPAEPAPTVREACERYGEAFKSRGTSGGALPGQRLANHVLNDPQIADVPLDVLESEDIRNWRRRLREKAVAETTVRRISNDFRAALNAAVRSFRRSLSSDLSDEIKSGFEITGDDPPAESERPSIILTDDEIRRLTAAAREIDAENDWEGDLFALVIGLAATGARFSQVKKIPIEWFQETKRRVLAPSSRKGRSKKDRPPASIPIGEDAIEIFARCAGARPDDEPLFMRWAYRRAGGLKWEKDKRRAWEASEISEPFKQIVARAELPQELTAYALRHSSIVRQLRKGLPIRLVAAMHDTSSEMIESHYSKHIVGALEEMAAGAVIRIT
jgi:site-specific recombinase XerD